MNDKEKFDQWLNFDEETKKELISLSDESEIHDRFYKELNFGTGGLRGVMGAGTNRINSYTIRKATFALSQYLQDICSKDIKVVIAYDSRNNSKQYALDTASVLCACNIKTYIFNSLMPTPVLSFAVKYLQCSAGVVITASHNPKEYNGYKVYDRHGCQIVPEDAGKVIAFSNTITDLLEIPQVEIESAIKSNQLEILEDDQLKAFLNAVKQQSVYNENSCLKVIYTPLHGSGNIPVRSILAKYNVSIVNSQEIPDGNFPTINSPNPEDRDALAQAIKQAVKEYGDIVLGTDPDCDRVGVAVKHKNEYQLLSGNQIGALLVDFVSSQKEINRKSTLVKTIVTNDLGAEIGASYGLNIVETLTGFKYIGEQITIFEETGNNEFFIGYEESYGFLVGTHAQDKDAVVASMLICEMAAYYKNQNMTLVDVLDNLYKKYGYYLDDMDTFTFEGSAGEEKIRNIMSHFRTNGKMIIPTIKEIKDYSLGIDQLRPENVLKFIFVDDSWIAIRPSGTEPKLKIYYSIKSDNKTTAYQKLSEIRKIVEELCNL